MRKLLSFLLLLAALALTFEIASNPLRRSEEHIKEELLTATPLGTPMEEVEAYIGEQGWEIRELRLDTGFYDQRPRSPVVTGDKYIRASLGDYQDIPFKANVTVYWEFSERSELIDIWVWKGWDSL